MDKDNVGYDTLIGLAYAYKEDVSAISFTGIGKVNVVLKGSNTWNTVYFTPGSGKWKETLDRSQRAGLIYKQKLQVNCTKDLDIEWNEVEQLTTRRLLLRLEFINGSKLLGSLENAVLIDMDMDTSGGLDILISADRQSVDRAMWIDMPVVDVSGE